MSAGRLVMDGAYRLGRHRLWWLPLIALGLVSGALAATPVPWRYLLQAPVLAAGLLLVDGHARWQRDDVVSRVQEAQRGG